MEIRSAWTSIKGKRNKSSPPTKRRKGLNNEGRTVWSFFEAIFHGRGKISVDTRTFSRTILQLCQMSCNNGVISAQPVTTKSFEIGNGVLAQTVLFNSQLHFTTAIFRNERKSDVVIFKRHAIVRGDRFNTWHSISRTCPREA